VRSLFLFSLLLTFFNTVKRYNKGGEEGKTNLEIFYKKRMLKREKYVITLQAVT